MVQSAATALIYLDLRIRREGLDLELARFVEAKQSGDQAVPDPYLTSQLAGAGLRRQYPAPAPTTGPELPVERAATLGMMPALAGLAGAVADALTGDVPVDPDAETARQWIIQELSKPEYQAAQPTWFDRLSTAFWDWLRSLDFSALGAVQLPALVLTVAVFLAAIVAAFLIFGRPRLRRRSALGGSLFGEDDVRDAQAIRAAARAAAGSGQWTIATLEMFRALARGLAERTVLTVSPGTTAHDFARRAGHPFPPFAGRLVAAADVFDRLRYLGRDGTATDYEAMAALESELRRATPILESPILDAPAGRRS